MPTFNRNGVYPVPRYYYTANNELYMFLVNLSLLLYMYSMWCIL